MERGDTLERKSHKHRGKFTEGLLNNEVVLKALNIKAGQTILDAGCGNGYMSRLFSGEVSQSGKVYALDPDKYFIKVLKNEIQGTNIEAIEGVTMKLIFRLCVIIFIVLIMVGITYANKDRKGAVTTL
jgi:SAM-dependent methyltransferase